MDETGVGIVAPFRNGVVDREARIGLGELVGARGRAGDPAGDVGEGVVTVGVLDEGVGVFGRNVFDAEGDVVITERVFTGDFAVGFFRGDGIQLAGRFGAEEDGAVGDRGAGVEARAAEALDLDLREGFAVVRRRAVVFRVGEAGFGAEVGGPLAEELGRVAVGVTGLRVPVVAQRGGRGTRVVRERDVLAVHATVGERQAVSAGDIPVDLGDRGFLEGDVVGAEVTGFVAEGFGAGHDGGDIGGVGDEVGLGRSGFATEIFVGEEEEQFVLQDRAADGDAVGALFEDFFELGDGILVAPILVGALVVEAAVELVGAGFDDGIQVSARGARAADVVGGEIDAEALDGVERDGAAEGGETVAVEAERIGGLHAVDGEGVEAEVLALGAELAALVEGHEGETRVGRGDVLDIAADAGDVLDFLVAERGAGAHFAAAEGGVTLGTDGEFFELDDIGFEREILRGGFVQIDVDVFGGLRGLAGGGGGDRVRTADAQVGEIVLAVGAGRRGGDGAGRFVEGGDGRAGKGFAGGVGDGAVKATGRDTLREHAREHGQR